MRPPSPPLSPPLKRRGLFAAMISVGVHLAGAGLLLAWPTPEDPVAPVILEVGRLQLPGAAPGAMAQTPDAQGPSDPPADPPRAAAPSPAAPTAPTPVTSTSPAPSPPATEADLPPEDPEVQPNADARQALATLSSEPESVEASPRPTRASPLAGRSAAAMSWVDDALAALPAEASEGEQGAAGPRNPTLSDGYSGALAPERGGADASALAVWRVRVQSRLMRGFRPPPASHEDLACRVHVWIDPDTGDVTRTALAESSGVVAWDQAALRAVESAGTLPAPPLGTAPLLSDGFGVRFVHPKR